MAKEPDSSPQAGINTENHGDSPKGSSGALGLQLPVDRLIWEEARRLIADKKVRVEDLATCCLQDPVIVIELLKKANAMFFSGGRPPITSTTTAIVRLGSEVVHELLEDLKERKQYAGEDVNHWIMIHRSRGKRTSIVARILAEALVKPLSDDCQAAGLLSTIGEMLAVGFFQEKYVALADELSRSGIIYRLSQDHKFDVERMGLLYLRRNGIPEALLFALDRDAMLRSQERAIMKPLVMSAAELVDAFDSNKWERFAPGKTLPAKSNIRLLQMNDSQFLKVYERAGEYLYSVRMAEEKKRAELVREQSLKLTQSVQSAISPVINSAPQNQSPSVESGSSLQDDIQNLLSGMMPETQIVTTEIPLDTTSINLTRSTPTKPVEPLIVKEPIIPFNQKGDRLVQGLLDSFETVSSTEELLSNILGMLLEGGLFQKTALIVVSKDRKSAQVVAARGPMIEKGIKLAIDDPLSPLAECFSKVQSFSNKKSQHSPWGSKSFALAPLDIGLETPVALYADCGDVGSVTFEGRRIFRTVIELLNQKLPQLPGGIPVDL